MDESTAKATAILERKGVRATPNRVMLLASLLRVRRTLSMADLEDLLETVDKSGISRTLSIFLAHDIVHAIEDGSGVMKYEACHGDEGHSPADMHVHFHCEGCGSTFCLESTGIPAVDLPAGFTPHSVNYTVKGLCPECTARRH